MKENDYDIVVEEQMFEPVKIIDMQNAENSISIPLSSILKEISIKKKREKTALEYKKRELEASMRELKRNIEETQREMQRFEKIKAENEEKRKMKEFLGKSEEFRNDFDLFCGEVQKLPKQTDSIMIPIIKENEMFKDLNKMARLKKVLNPEIYEKVIYFLWWPSVRETLLENNHVDDDFGSLDTLKSWSHLLPNDFLVYCVGNQILVPRLHFLLQRSPHEISKIKSVWEFLVTIGLGFVISDEVVKWLGERISTVKIGKFEELLNEFTEEWKKSISLQDLMKLKETFWYHRLQRLLQRDLVIDPSNQDLLPLECTFLCLKTEIIDKSQVSKLLSAHLMPKLKRLAQVWLKDPQVNYEEVAEWYMAWKEYIPTELMSEDILLDGFAEILQVINENL